MGMDSLNDMFFTSTASESLSYDQILEDVQKYCTEKHSDKLRQRLIAHVEKRIQRAYPAIVQPEPTVQKEKALSFGDLVWLFVIGAFLGDVVETLFCRVTAGVWRRRASLVW